MSEAEMQQLAEIIVRGVQDAAGTFSWDVVVTTLGPLLGALVLIVFFLRPAFNRDAKTIEAILASHQAASEGAARSADVQAVAATVSALSQSVNALAQTVASRQDVHEEMDTCSRSCQSHREKEWALTRQQLNGQSKAFDKLCDSLGETTMELRRSVSIMETTPANVALQVGVVLRDREHVERLQQWSDRIRELKARREKTSNKTDFDVLTRQIRELEANPPNGH